MQAIQEYYWKQCSTPNENEGSDQQIKRSGTCLHIYKLIDHPLNRLNLHWKKSYSSMTLTMAVNLESVENC